MNYTIHTGKAWLYGRALCAFMAALLCACTSDNKKQVPDDALVKINDKVLTARDLRSQMPGGLNKDDSTKYANAYINSWINSELISQVASKEINMAEIDKQVAQYRNELIMWEYTRRMFDSHFDNSIPEDSIQAYYEKYKDEFVLTRPMVKGVYLKVADDSPSLPTLRKLYRSQEAGDIDNLDKSELNGAVHYDYFRDKWIDWEQIEYRIPYDFGPSADIFLKNNSGIDTSQGGFTYLLDITDVLHTGQVMPLDAARQQIIDRIRFYSRRKFEDNLKKNLYDKAVSSGKITIYYDN